MAILKTNTDLLIKRMPALLGLAQAYHFIASAPPSDSKALKAAQNDTAQDLLDVFNDMFAPFLKEEVKK